jgi:hypothetical protein
MDSSKLEIALWIYMIFWRLEHVEKVLDGFERDKPAAHPGFTTGVETAYFVLISQHFVGPNT